MAVSELRNTPNLVLRTLRQKSFPLQDRSRVVLQNVLQKRDQSVRIMYHGDPDAELRGTTHNLSCPKPNLTTEDSGIMSTDHISKTSFKKSAACLLVPVAIITGSWLLVTPDLHGQDPALDAFRQMQAALQNEMSEDLDQAIVYLDAQIEKQPESYDVQVLRHSLASKLANEERYVEALEQYQELLDFQIAHLEEQQYGVGMTIRSLTKISELSNRSEETEKAVNKALTAFRALPAESTRAWDPLSQLVVLKAHSLVEDKRADEAATAVAKHVEALEDACKASDTTESIMHAHVALLKRLTNPNRDNDQWREDYITKLDTACTTAFERFPKSMRLQNNYAETQYLMITQWGQDDPEANEKRIETAFAKLSLPAISNRSVNAILRRIEIHRERMQTAKPVASLVGQAAPEWDIDGWANTVGVTRKSFEGQVVLLDFWAMWCGPCIATFPHLREWREEFGGQGFEIVGVTQYYNFEWDDEQKRASRASDEITPQQERETLASFLDHHQLEHPVMVAPKNSEMSSDYGVKGIPHVVLIDRDGTVQLVKTGAGPATAKEIHDKIKELLAPAN
jgi:thiol-disulfide isomerase/thioredoxin